MLKLPYLVEVSGSCQDHCEWGGIDTVKAAPSKRGDCQKGSFGRPRCPQTNKQDVVALGVEVEQEGSTVACR